MKKIIISLITIVLLVGGYFYYTERLQPSSFVSSFCEKLEYEGPESLELRDYFLSNFDVTPIISWADYYEESNTKNLNLSKEQLFEIWSKVYLSRCVDYVDVSLQFPQISIMTSQQFKKTYKKFRFSNFSIDYKKYHKNSLKASGYVEVTFKGSSLGNAIFGGKQKFTLLAQNGSSGWKAIVFSLDTIIN